MLNLGLADLQKRAPEEIQELSIPLFFLGASSIGWNVLAIVLTLSTMRPRNGYRGLHEFISGTRTYHLRWPRPVRRRAIGRRGFALEMQRVEGLPESIGPFRVKGALRWTHSERVLQAEDPHLGRAVWIWMRPASAPALTQAAREVNRGTRMRWVTCGVDEAWQWDVFVGPTGTPLPELAAGELRLSWGEVRPIFEDLAEELDAACTDRTLPATLGVGQVWIQPDGRVQLIEVPLADAPMSYPDEAEERAFGLLGEVAVTALEGAVRLIEAERDRVRVPLPAYASDLLDRVLCGSRRFQSVAEVRQELELVRERPVQVSRQRRAAHLVLMFGLMQLPVAAPVLFLTFPGATVIETAFFEGQPPNEHQSANMCIFLIASCVAWIVWAILFRGGITFWLTGISLRRRDGRKAGRFQCCVRTLLLVGPALVLYCAAIMIASNLPQWSWLYVPIWAIGTLWLLLHPVLALVYPTRSLPDRLVGTCLVPR